jgi:calcineurin-like phosphoesterase family protein
MKKIDFVISDTHFGHRNILKYEPCRQGWVKDYNSLDEEEGVVAMSEAMIAAWNSVVSTSDVVLHLGDFAMGKKGDHPAIRARLNGSVILIKGNHDSKPEKNFLDFSRGDVLHEERFEFEQDGKLFICRHDPEHFTREEYERAYKLLCGHLHGNDYTSTTPQFVRSKALCMSIERLPCAPSPMRFSEIHTFVSKPTSK